VALSLERGADVKTYDNFGNTAMHSATECSHEVVMRLYAGYGADLNAKDRGGRVPLHRAAKNGYETVVRQLLELHADVCGQRTSLTT